MILLTLIQDLCIWLRLLAQGLAPRAIFGSCNLTRPDAEPQTTSKPSKCHAHDTQCPARAAVDHAWTHSGYVVRESVSQRPANPTQRRGSTREFDTPPGRHKRLLNKQSLVAAQLSING